MSKTALTNQQIEEEGMNLRFRHHVALPGNVTPVLRALVQEVAALARICKTGTVEEAEKKANEVMACRRAVDTELKKLQHGIKLLELERQRDDERRQKLQREVDRVQQLAIADEIVNEPFPGKSEAEAELRRLDEQIEEMQADVQQRDRALDLRKKQLMMFFSLLDEMQQDDSRLLQLYSEVGQAVNIAAEKGLELAAVGELMAEGAAAKVQGELAAVGGGEDDDMIAD